MIVLLLIVAGLSLYLGHALLYPEKY
ncbi:potassium-transporting ATPase subunit F [Brevibacillus agri]|uniref:Potassium-transporting ATPase subunit F n=1 Tax=Brevibacillus agri TaxID=51101 RepID=A0A3M8BB00_9BACL|nr:potassium-transporting ATPase subunit F [Brevibacillus agri]QAV15951.1 potassium-transporting ATPase subunit F [Brevibacillus agri]QHZ59287.1 potassium-transporting ATPase subunit F [Brevibacillus sp. NSP2.1]RNB60549.1 potassium-transporting ATPase subunit F [Brevibacillus agri]